MNEPGCRPHRRLRRTLPALALGVLLLAGNGCGVAYPAAARVNDTKIDRSDFEEELEAIRDNPLLQKNGALLIGTGKDTINSRISTGWLTNQVYDALVREEIARRKIEISAADMAAAEAQFKEQFGSEEVSAEFPGWFKRRVLARTARLVALRAALAGYNRSDAGLQKYYDDNRAEFDEVCVAHILVESKADADAALARLRAGASFAALAQELSGDPGSAPTGGDLGCPRKGLLVAAFEKAAFEATPGQVTAPVETEFGWHLILVGKHTTKPFAVVKEDVAAAVDQKGRDAFRAFLPKAIRTSTVTIDPRFGTFVAPDDDSNALPSVVPPPAPNPPDGRPENKGSGTTTTTLAPLPVPQIQPNR
jgi:hypothetical protein